MVQHPNLKTMNTEQKVKEMYMDIRKSIFGSPKNERVMETVEQHCSEWLATPFAQKLINELQGMGGMRWVKVNDKTPNYNSVYRQWWENTYSDTPKGEWMYFNGKINEHDEVYDDDGGVNPVNQDTVEWLDESTPSQSQGDGYEKLREKMKNYFNSTTGDEIIQKFESMGYTFVPLNSSQGDENADKFAIQFAGWVIGDEGIKYRSLGVSASKLLEIFKDRPYIDPNPLNQ